MATEDLASVKIDTMNDIAQAIIDKGGATEPMKPAMMAEAIRGISGGSTGYVVRISPNCYPVSFGSMTPDYGSDSSGFSSNLLILDTDDVIHRYTAYDIRMKKESGNLILCENAVGVKCVRGGGHWYFNTASMSLHPFSRIGLNDGTENFVLPDEHYQYGGDGYVGNYDAMISWPSSEGCYGMGIYARTIPFDEKFHHLDSDVTVMWMSSNCACFLKGSKISLSDGSIKNCEDITYDDNLLTWNFDEGKYDFAKPIWIKRAETNDYYFHCKFKSGITFDITGQSETGWGHRGLNLTRNSFTYFPASVGDVFCTKNGPDRLVSCERLEKEVEFYNIITEQHFNLFANDILTSCSLNNLYPIKDMKFVKDNRELRKIEDYIGVDQRYFDALRLAEQNGDIKKLSQYVHNLKMKEI